MKAAKQALAGVTVLILHFAACPNASTAAAQLEPKSPTVEVSFYPANCLAIKQAKPDSFSGVYKIYPDAQLETRTAIDASCDMITDGGGWTLILNYNHESGTTPPRAMRSYNVPVAGSDILDDDDSAKAQFWDHAGNALLGKFAFRNPS